MSVPLDLTTASYLLFRLLPFLVATVLSLAPLLVFSWKGAPYLGLLLLTLVASSALGPMLTRGFDGAFSWMIMSWMPPSWMPSSWMPGAASTRVDAVCSAFVLGAGTEPYSVAAPLDVALLSFSTLYLFYFIERNRLGQIYRGLQVVFPLLTTAYLAFLMRHGCTSFNRALSALLVGGLGGWLGAAFVAKHYPSLMYLAAPTSRQSCTRVSDTVFTCRGGDPNQNAD